MASHAGPSVAALTLRTRAVYFLPIEYEFIEIEIRVGDATSKASWVSERVPVEKNGTALVDFWARIPTSARSNKTHISFKVRHLSLLHQPTMHAWAVWYTVPVYVSMAKDR